MRPGMTAVTVPRRPTATPRPGAGVAAGRAVHRGADGAGGQLLRRKWSAEQISGALTKTGEMAISHETIYRRIRWDKLAGGNLWRHTRIMSNQRRKRYRGADSRGVLPGKKHISERPEEVESRQRTGHWVGDTVMGSDLRHCVLTLVECKTGFAIIK